MLRRTTAAALAIFFAALQAASAETAFVGTTYSHRQSGYLEIDWKETYLEILKLGFYTVRLGAYWDEIEAVEGTYDFSTLDWQVAEARKRNVPVVLTVGMKAPRWPEFFIPRWLDEKIRVKPGGEVTRDPVLREKTLEFVRRVVLRYRDEPAVRYWQVENEALDRSGPKYWWIGPAFLREEIDLVRSLDGDRKRPIILTVATYPNTFLFLLARFRLDTHPIYQNLELCDILGINVYPVVGQMFWKFKLYFWTRPEERAEYFSKVLKLVKKKGKRVWIMELQAEPWEPGMLVHMTKERPPSGWPEVARESFSEFRRLGFPVIFFWGAEYWYYRSIRQEDAHWWDMARDVLRKSAEKVL
jgi:hypothetical protein